MGIEKIKEDLLFFIVVVPIFLALIFMTLFSFNRESAHNRRVLEYEAGRLASDLLELAGRGDASALRTMRPDVLGFGVYPAAGPAAFRTGTAPETLPPREGGRGGPEFALKDGRLVMIRFIGFPMPMNRGMGRMMHGPRGRDPQPPESERSAWPAGIPVRRLYLEIDVIEWRRRQLPLRFGQYFVPAALAAALFGVSRMYRKNRGYRLREERNRQLVSLGEAARTLTHEIKNPLGAIKIQTATLRKIVPGEYHKNLEIIGEETDRLTHLVDRVGEFLRNPRGEPRIIDLGPFVGDMLKRFSFPIGYLPPGPPVPVLFDPHLLRTVLENLLKNAVESVEGRLPADSGEEAVRVEVKTGKGTAVVRVLDRGKGLPENADDRIFDPFYTTKTKGSGIGLAVSKRFVEAAGGSLRIGPRDGGGTETEVTLPREAG